MFMGYIFIFRIPLATFVPPSTVEDFNENVYFLKNYSFFVILQYLKLLTFANIIIEFSSDLACLLKFVTLYTEKCQ